MPTNNASSARSRWASGLTFTFSPTDNQLCQFYVILNSHKKFKDPYKVLSSHKQGCLPARPSRLNLDLLGFHVSLLKMHVGVHTRSSPTLPPSTTEGCILAKPIKILEHHLVTHNNLPVPQVL